MKVIRRRAGRVSIALAPWPGRGHEALVLSGGEV